MQQFVRWLQEEHDAIMGCEAEALRLLKAGDKAGYDEYMRGKATRLAALAEKARRLLVGVPGPEAARVGDVLARFSGSAAMSLQINSVFFMSALLYKDEHKADEPDNLQALINSLTGEEL